MGNFTSKKDEERYSIDRDDRVKLATQQVPSFLGKNSEWKKWQKKTRAALGTTGYIRVLDDRAFARRHMKANETVFHALQVSVADGTASHLVDRYTTTLDGNQAWNDLTDWYDGDDTTTKTAEEIRTKLAVCRLTTETDASEYINFS